MKEQGFVTPRDAAQLLKISRGSVYRMLSKGTIPSVRTGKSRFIRVADLRSLFPDVVK